MDRNAFRHDAEVEFGTVGQAMTGRPLTFEPHDRASDAALRMTSDGVSGAPVVERGRVVGVIALSDLLTRQGHLAPQTTGYVPPRRAAPRGDDRERAHDP